MMNFTVLTGSLLHNTESKKSILNLKILILMNLSLRYNFQRCESSRLYFCLYFCSVQFNWFSSVRLVRFWFGLEFEVSG